MKNRFLNFLRKYWLCILFSVIMIIGVSVSTYCANLYESGRGYIRFDLRELCLVFGLPVYSIIYGCLSYIKTKRIWVPQFILCIITFLYWFRFDINELAWAGTFIWSAYPVIFSLIGTGITSLIYKMVKSIKKNNN